jgi:hypothetical protein
MSSNRFDRVEPGDVITSELINYVLSKLREHDDRLGDIESNPTDTRVTISEIIPPDQEAINRPLELRGTNYLFPPEQNTVRVGGVPVTQFLASSPTFLRFVIPRGPDTTRPVEIEVVNSNGRVARIYRVTSEVPVVGSPPTITDARTDAGSTTLRVGQPVIITGTNFATSPSNNIIQLRSRATGAESEVYNVTNIDTSQTTQAQIRATLPTNIVIHNTAAGDLMQLSVTVGAHIPAERTVSVRLPSSA